MKITQQRCRDGPESGDVEDLEVDRKAMRVDRKVGMGHALEVEREVGVGQALGENRKWGQAFTIEKKKKHFASRHVYESPMSSFSYLNVFFRIITRNFRE